MPNRDSISTRGAGLLARSFSKADSLNPNYVGKTTLYSAEAYRDKFMKPNASLSRLLRLARMIRQERAGS